MNQGIQKYKESSRSAKSSSQAGKSDEKAAAPVKAPGKSPKPVPPKGGTRASAKKVEPAMVSKKAGKAAEEPKLEVGEVTKAVIEIAVAEEAALAEEALQKEIAEELARESATTNQLVKEDFSPLNSSREQLVLEYAPLIKYIAQKIAARLPANIELDDLISSGVIGLIDAIEKYDATRDNKFKTYAEFRIRGAILDELRAQDWVPRSVREKAKLLEKCYSRIEQRVGRQATDEEVCKELNISQDEYFDLLNQVRSVSLLSFDDISSFSKADKRSLHGYGESGQRSPTPFNEVNVAHIKKLIAEAIHDLPEKQRLVLSLYYYEDLNLKEIGRVLDVTESRVSQLHTQAILRLKGKLRNHWDDFVSLFG
ncbi:MAG TPA: FliA/WhiG family RNA polymerase sigma factor [Bdellovibrionota bacterium]|nr:FliA/WhiG family RNA polymerase sigma factor [Bdellovibrionota bacterium]